MEGGGWANTTQTGNLQHRYCNTGVFLETKATFFCPLHPKYVKKEKKMERKHIFILLYRRDTWNQDTTGALFTHKQDVGNHVNFRFHPPEATAEMKGFFVFTQGFFFSRYTHPGSTESL